MKKFCRTVWEPQPEPGVNGKIKSCSIYHCPRCGAIMKPTPLTAREVEILRAYAEGLSTREIARLRFIDEKTVESHRRQIMLKLGAPNMTKAVVMGIQQGVILI